MTQNGKRGLRAGRKPGENIPRPDADDGEEKASIVEHVRMVTSLIEGRRVSMEEILKMLSRALRQHSMGRRRRIDYIVERLNKAAP